MEHEEPGTEQRVLRCYLTEDEKIQAGRELAERLRDIEESEKDFEEQKKVHKSFLQRLTNDVCRLKDKINLGYERRDVECSWVFDYRAGTKTLVRMDTGEQVDTVQLSEEEQQAALPLEPEEEDHQEPGDGLGEGDS